MPIKWKEGTLVCLACGLVLWNGQHEVHKCSQGWCKPQPLHMPDVPHAHFRTTPPSTGAVVMDTGSTST